MNGKSRKRSKVKMGFIGAGTFVSAHHLLNARDSKIIEIRAIADIDEKVLTNHTARFNLAYTSTDYRELLCDPQIDIIVIGTKQDLHAKLIVESLEAGKWVFCEKPMAETEEEIQAVLAAEKKATGKLAIGFNRRFAPACMDAKKIIQKYPKPWFINYRLMYPNPGKAFYQNHERILYEGTHILDLLCWLYDSEPQRLTMTGDKYKNNCCILEFPEGSQAAFMCGSMGTYCHWKEKMEIYAKYAVICVDDFISMNVRGVPGEKDRLFAPYKNEHAEEIMKYGFDFYEEYKVKEKLPYKDDYLKQLGMVIEKVKRPTPPRPFDVFEYSPENKEIPGFIPDKGWANSLEHFAWCNLEGSEPQNANGRAGAISSRIALKLLESLESKKTVDFNQSNEPVLSGCKKNDNS